MNKWRFRRSFGGRHFLIGAALVGGSASFFMGKWGLGWMVLAQSAIQPFYLERTVSQSDATGKMVPFAREIIVRRSDGTTARLESMGPVESPTYARTIRFMDGKSVTVVDAVHGKSTWPLLDPENVSHLKSDLTRAPRTCGAAPTEVQRFDRIDGVDYAVTQKLRSGTRITRWSASRLGCEDMYYKSEQLTPDGSVGEVIESRLDQFVAGEPEDHWFTVETSYDEIPPSEMELRLEKEFGVTLTGQDLDRTRRILRRSDQYYNSKTRSPNQSGPSLRSQYEANLRTRLSLTAEQMSKLGAILADTAAAFKRLGKMEGPEAEAIRDGHNARVRAILTAAQQVEFDRHRQEVRTKQPPKQ